MTVPRDRFWGVLLAGGQGERLWPWSRQDCPKQFLPITDHRSLLQTAYARLRRAMPRDQIYVIGSAEHAALVRRQLPGLPRARWVGEPVGRNTAAAAGLGALLIGRHDPGAVMVVATADHLITPTDRWVRCLQAAAGLALEDVDRLICLGVRPTAPTTGYGYLVPAASRRRLAHRVWAAPLRQFVEKPSRPVAQQLIRRGAYWNSGMFVWSIPAIARALQRCLPHLTRGLVTTIRGEVGTAAFAAQMARVYRTLPAISIDHGVMEHADDCWMVSADFAWDDVGSWTSLWRYLPRDRHGNAVRGRHLGIETTQTLVFGPPDGLIATIGVRDLIIAQHGDVTLVASRAGAQRVRELAAQVPRGVRYR